jgi:hypothetical protein
MKKGDGASGFSHEHDKDLELSGWEENFVAEWLKDLSTEFEVSFGIPNWSILYTGLLR